MGRLSNYKNKPGETPFDADGLIPSYITTRKELDEAEFLNISEATKFYLSNLSKINKFKMIREDLFDLHKRMFSNVWSWAGKKRASNKNIGVEFFKVDEEIKKLEGDFIFWEENNTDLIELIAKLHHRLVWIHPFEGGNGRWSRLVTNLILYKKLKKMIEWPDDEIQLKKASSFRENYLKALKESDEGRFKKLTELFKILIM